jgi:two-component system CheB/CheR fusion protein
VAENLREAAFDLGGTPQIVLDINRNLVIANLAARRLFGLDVGDYGRPVHDLDLSHQPVELRAHLDTLVREPRSSELSGIQFSHDDHELILDIRLAPLLGDGVVLGATISYHDVTEVHGLKLEITDSKNQLEQAYEELQSTVEELETTNEELQSTNEELETMNEELQSSNEELETMNEELRYRSAELNELNSFLETILTTIGLAVAVLDRRQHVQIWNGQARDLWGLSPEEAEDQHLLALDFGLPLERLRQPLQSLLGNGSSREELVLEATNRRGKPFQCRVICLPLHPSGDGDVSGVIVMMEPVP